jgi:hypothetical protein
MWTEPESAPAVARTGGIVAGDPRAHTSLLRRLRAFLRACSPILQGFLGALLLLVLYLAGSWTLARYTEFTVMRSVVSQILENDRKAHPPTKAPDVPEKTP